MKKINVNIYGMYISMFQELLSFFENACDCLYYGEGKKQWLETTSKYMSEDDARKLWKCAWEFMGDEKQPNLDSIADIKLCIDENEDDIENEDNDSCTEESIESEECIKARDIIENFDPIAVKYEEDKDGWEVLIKDNYSSLEFWIDAWIGNSGEIQTEWNQYIFYTSGIDAIRSQIQDDADVCSICCELAIQCLIDNDRVYEDENDKWHKNKHNN